MEIRFDALSLLLSARSSLSRLPITPRPLALFLLRRGLPSLFPKCTSLLHDSSTSYGPRYRVSRQALIFPLTFTPSSFRPSLPPFSYPWKLHTHSHGLFEMEKEFPRIPPSNYPTPFVVAFSYYFLSCPVERYAIKAKFLFSFLPLPPPSLSLFLSLPRSFFYYFFFFVLAVLF